MDKNHLSATSLLFRGKFLIENECLIVGYIIIQTLLLQQKISEKEHNIMNKQSLI